MVCLFQIGSLKEAPLVHLEALSNTPPQMVKLAGTTLVLVRRDTMHRKLEILTALRRGVPC